jgi:hypothetical protein
MSAGFFASDAKQQTSSYPKYPKKEDVAPRKIPVAPKGAKGVILSAWNNMNPPTIIKITKRTFSIVNTLVIVLDSCTPQAKMATERAEMKPAKGLKNSPTPKDVAADSQWN